MSALVIDASVAIKWVIEEPGTEAALKLRAFRLLAPELLVAECANILWKKVRRGELTKAEAGIAGGLLRRAAIELVPMRDVLDHAVEMAIDLDHPAYDCVYLSLAEQAACPFVTADARLCARVSSMPRFHYVSALGRPPSLSGAQPNQ